MLPIDKIREIFENYGGVMRTADLSASKIYYADIQKLIREGVIEKVRYGYYQWVDKETYSEVMTVTGLFPDGIFCMNTALFYHGYSDRTPLEWHIAMNTGKVPALRRELFMQHNSNKVRVGERRQAEFLVSNNFSLNLVQGIGVYNSESAHNVESILKGTIYSIPVDVCPA